MGASGKQASIVFWLSSTFIGRQELLNLNCRIHAVGTPSDLQAPPNGDRDHARLLALRHALPDYVAQGYVH